MSAPTYTTPIGLPGQFQAWSDHLCNITIPSLETHLGPLNLPYMTALLNAHSEQISMLKSYAREASYSHPDIRGTAEDPGIIPVSFNTSTNPGHDTTARWEEFAVSTFPPINVSGLTERDIVETYAALLRTLVQRLEEPKTSLKWKSQPGGAHTACVDSAVACERVSSMAANWLRRLWEQRTGLNRTLILTADGEREVPFGHLDNCRQVFWVNGQGHAGCGTEPVL